MSPNISRYEQELVVLYGKIYLIGETPWVERYDLDTNRWDFVASMNFAREGHRCCVVNGEIYAIGGKNDEIAEIPAIEKYNVRLNKWTVVSMSFCVCVCYFFFEFQVKIQKRFISSIFPGSH